MWLKDIALTVYTNIDSFVVYNNVKGIALYHLGSNLSRNPFKIEKDKSMNNTFEIKDYIYRDARSDEFSVRCTIYGVPGYETRDFGTEGKYLELQFQDLQIGFPYHIQSVTSTDNDTIRVSIEADSLRHAMRICDNIREFVAHVVICYLP